MDYFFNSYYVYSNYVPTDIYPVQYGQERCMPSHDFGPAVRNNYIIHYVYSGKGIFKVEDKEYTVGAGQMFLIKPNELTYYKADTDDPWLYRWLEFNGSMAENVLSVFDTPVIEGNERIADTVRDIVENGDMRFELLMQKFWAFIAHLTHNTRSLPKSQSEEYIEKSVLFIKNNIHKKVTVYDIAKHVGIDRSYLSRLFKEYLSISPQRYILNVKMNAAAQYLKNTDISIAETAKSVGYEDYHVFNKVFKNHFGISPSAWRKKKFWEQSFIE